MEDQNSRGNTRSAVGPARDGTIKCNQEIASAGD